MVEETNSGFEKLLFENIKIDSTGADVERNEAFAHIKVKLTNLGNPNALLKVKVDTGAQGNILPLRINFMEKCFQIAFQKIQHQAKPN